MPDEPEGSVQARSSEQPSASVGSPSTTTAPPSAMPVPGEPVLLVATGPTPSRRARTAVIVAGVIVVVAALVGLAVAVGSGGKPAATSTKPPPPSPSVGPPEAVTAAGEAVPLGVTVSWRTPSGKAVVLGYRIFRDGTQIAAVPASATTYVDSNVTPGKTYTYEVLARGDGILESGRVSTQVTVPTPPLAAARLDGNFNVKLRTVSQSGYIDRLGSFTLGWNFDPKCSEGACAVVWTDLGNNGVKATLRRSGVSYRGRDKAKFTGQCNSVQGTSTLELTLRVTKARAIAGDWRATRLTGTLKESHPSQFGCVSGGATFALALSLAI
jgi:hypothetical protein